MMQIAMFQQLTEAANIYLSAYLQTNFFNNKIIKSSTFRPAVSTQELERKIVYFLKSLTIKSLTAADLLKDISRVSVRNNSLTICFNYAAVLPNGTIDMRSIISRLMSGELEAILNRQSYLDLIRNVQGVVDRRFMNLDCSIHDMHIYLSPYIWHNSSVSDGYNVLERPILQKAKLIYDILVNVGDICVEVANYRNRCISIVNADGTPNDAYRFNMLELYYIAKQTNVASIGDRLQRMIFREVIVNFTSLVTTGVDLKSIVYDLSYFVAGDLIRIGTRHGGSNLDMTRITELNVFIKAKCTENNVTVAALGGA
jgi:hypothetical protein